MIFEDLPPWLFPFSLTIIMSFGFMPIGVIIWGFDTNFVHLHNPFHWLLWLYFGPVGGLAFVIDRLKKALNPY